MINFIKKELQHGAHNYTSINVCVKKATGIILTDINNKEYYDFVAGYSAINQGHCHPRLINVLTEQSKNLTLTSRAIYNNILGDYMEFITNEFQYDKVLPMNTGVEGGETAIKLARKWGYEIKNIEKNKAVNLFCENNFWGRTIAAASSSTDPICYNNFGPFNPGFDIIKYNCLESLENKLISNSNIVSFMVEPIQGEAGIIIPDINYMKNVKKICKKHNVLLIADEVQTGLGRTGRMLACDYDYIKPDILILGKALSGGMLPVSAVLANNSIMNVITPGTHGSTFGGNPLASAVAIEAIKIIKDEKLCENSYELGINFRKELFKLQSTTIKNIRGRGLLNAIEFKTKEHANKFCYNLLDNGIIAKTTHNTVVRMSPPLTITKKQIEISLNRVEKSLKNI